MADIKRKVKGNSPGKFYVDDSCIACDACILAAPDNFVMNDVDGYAVVKAQPTNDAELAACREALETCPVEAIGDNG